MGKVVVSEDAWVEPEDEDVIPGLRVELISGTRVLEELELVPGLMLVLRKGETVGGELVELELLLEATETELGESSELLVVPLKAELLGTTVVVMKAVLVKVAFDVAFSGKVSVELETKVPEIVLPGGLDGVTEKEGVEGVPVDATLEDCAEVLLILTSEKEEDSVADVEVAVSLLLLGTAWLEILEIVGPGGVVGLPVDDGDDVLMFSPVFELSISVLEVIRGEVADWLRDVRAEDSGLGLNGRDMDEELNDTEVVPRLVKLSAIDASVDDDGDCVPPEIGNEVVGKLEVFRVGLETLAAELTGIPDEVLKEPLELIVVDRTLDEKDDVFEKVCSDDVASGTLELAGTEKLLGKLWVDEIEKGDAVVKLPGEVMVVVVERDSPLDSAPDKEAETFVLTEVGFVLG
ncbi:hypothetical protein GQ53DRAFT_829969 [Thozetella sp. PMI_491]|nr:hypothetical protein GQ53DRAFT_829969 [Thozetella sp. PMI_491]